MNLHSDREAFREIAALSADWLGYEYSHVEKDYWVSKILRDISRSEYADKTYFKGGTSLSKAYGLIERFSEDLDLFVFTGDRASSKQAEKMLNRNLSRYITEHNRDIYRSDLSKMGGNYRRLYFSYDNLFQSVGLKEYMEVEIKSYDLSSLYYTPQYNEYLHSEDFLEAMYSVTVEDGLNKNSCSHLPLADAPVFKDAETIMALPEVTAAYASDLMKLVFDKTRMPSIAMATGALNALHGILLRFDSFRAEKLRRV